MSGTHVFDRPTYKNSLGEVVDRTVQGCRSVGHAVLESLSGGVSRFETAMTARSLPEGFVRSTGMAALEDVDPSYARKLEGRFNDN